MRSLRTALRFVTLCTLVVAGTFLLNCSKSTKSGGCEVTENPNKPCFMKVVNKTDDPLIIEFWYSIRIGDVTPDNCWLFGLDPGDYKVAFEKVGGDKSRWTSFTLQYNETHTITVTDSMF